MCRYNLRGPEPPLVEETHVLLGSSGSSDFFPLSVPGPSFTVDHCLLQEGRLFARELQPVLCLTWT